MSRGPYYKQNRLRKSSEKAYKSKWLIEQVGDLKHVRCRNYPKCRKTYWTKDKRREPQCPRCREKTRAKHGRAIDYQKDIRTWHIDRIEKEKLPQTMHPLHLVHLSPKQLAANWDRIWRWNELEAYKELKKRLKRRQHGEDT